MRPQQLPLLPTHKLTTQTLPVLTCLQNRDRLFESPFKSDVYFFSTRQKLDRKWGTPNPVTVRDKDFGVVRLRAFGIYAFHLVDPKLFHTAVSGTVERYATEQLESQLRKTIVGNISGNLGESGVSFIDMAANQLEFGNALKTKLDPMFRRYGLALDGLVVQNISRASADAAYRSLVAAFRPGRIFRRDVTRGSVDAS